MEKNQPVKKRISEKDAGYEKDTGILKPDSFEEAQKIIRYKNIVREKRGSTKALTKTEIMKIIGW